MDINYDTLVVEEGVLRIYPDVYERSLNRPWHLRRELETSHVDASNFNDNAMKRLMAKVTRRTQLLVETSNIERGGAPENGRSIPLIPTSKRTVQYRKR